LAVALTSPACNERDLLVKDFLETGARKGEVTFYVTIDPGAANLFAEEFPSNFHLFVCNPQADAIVEDLPNVLKLKGVENLTDVSMALTSAIRKLDPSLKGPGRICLDLVSDILLQHHAIQTRRWLISLLAELKSSGFTTLTVIDPQMHPSEELHAVLGLFDGDINIYEKETDEGLRKYLRIKKMGNSKYLEDELPLKNVSTSVAEARVSWEQSVSEEGGPYPKNRIAILPFASFSSDPNDAYFADGVTDEIISAVAGISGLSVISRTSVMGYKGTTMKVEEIGRELRVGSVLEGSFKKAGNKIRVTTQLIDVAADKHLWTQNYDRSLDDVFEVQSDVAKQVAEALRIRILSPEKERIEKKPTGSTSAYALYLKGRYLWNTWGLEDLKKAREYFKQAIEEDPDFALGYAGQADCCLLLGHYRIDSDANLARAKALATKALELNPELAEAHTTIGFKLADEGNFQRAEEEYRKAIELKPSYATSHYWYSLLLRRQYRWDEALEQIEKAEELDPLSPIITMSHAQCLCILGRMQESLHVLESAERLNPYSVFILKEKARLLMYLERANEAWECLEKASKIDPEDEGLLDNQGHYEQLVGNNAKATEYWERAIKRGRAEGGEVRGYMADFASLYWMTGDKNKAQECIRKIETLPEETYNAREYKMNIFACAYAGTGNSEKFFSMVGRMVEENSISFYWMRMIRWWYPLSREFLDDERWGRLFYSVGLEP
jgi:TolB-like protein/Tfp pilus assembly protein PilF/KaiC/GvpD/RAD55 family RecA-like ATPase